MKKAYFSILMHWRKEKTFLNCLLFNVVFSEWNEWQNVIRKYRKRKIFNRKMFFLSSLGDYLTILLVFLGNLYLDDPEICSVFWGKLILNFIGLHDWNFFFNYSIFSCRFCGFWEKFFASKKLKLNLSAPEKLFF